GEESTEYASELAELGRNLLRQQKWTDAETALRASLALGEKKFPEAWPTYYTQSLLGAALFGQTDYTAAEPLLLQGYQGMKQREKQISSKFKAQRLGEALERLVTLYEATGKKEEAAKWRKEWEATKTAQPKPETKP